MHRPRPTAESFPASAVRKAAGKRLRDRVSREEQSAWKAPAGSRADPLETLAASDAGRDRHLLPIKRERMAVSPFAFFRGAAPIMGRDLSALPVTGIQVQLCGDAHVRNLGAFAAPDGQLVFDINDFDESIPGPWEWDLKRLAVSVVLAGRDANDDEAMCALSVRELVRAYRESLSRFARMKVLALARFEIRRHSATGTVRAVLDKAEHATAAKTLAKLTEPGPDGFPRFHDRPPLLEHVPDGDANKVLAALDSYRETLNAGRRRIFDGYTPVDVAFKVVGTGSIGTRDYVVLFFGNGLEDPLFLQVKEELPSCYTPYLPGVPPFAHQGRRVAEAQLCMQTAATDLLLGWTTIDGKDFLVRQLADHKAAIDPAELKTPALLEYALVCGEALAKAHARTGDAAAIAGYCGKSRKLDKAVAQFARSYADRVAKDFALFTQAMKPRRTRKAA